MTFRELFAVATLAISSQAFTNVYPDFVGALASAGRATPTQLLVRGRTRPIPRRGCGGPWCDRFGDRDLLAGTIPAALPSYQRRLNGLKSGSLAFIRIPSSIWTRDSH